MTPRYSFHRLLFAKSVYRALPKPLRAFVSTPIYFFSDLLNNLRPEAWSISGEMQASHLHISACLYSTNLHARSYISNLIFGPAYHSRYLGRTWVWNTHKAHKAARDSSLLINELDKPYLKSLPAGCGVMVPSWVYGEIELPRGPNDRKCKRALEVRRQIRKYSLEYEITNDQKLFDDFYDNMYVAYIKQRHGDTAFIAPRKRMQARFDKGELLLVKKNGESIAGQLITYEGSCIHLVCLGIRDGKWEYVQNGAVSAIFEFSLRRAEEKGCRKVDLAKSRPFLNDGLLQFKRSWSQGIVGVVRNKFLLRILSDSPATRAFLENTPFIFERYGKLHASVFVNGETPLTQVALQRIHRQNYHSGLATLVVFQFSPQANPLQGEIDPALPSELSGNHPANLANSLQYKQLHRAEWKDLIRGLGCAGIAQAIAIYPQDEIQNTDSIAELKAVEGEKVENRRLQ